MQSPSRTFAVSCEALDGPEEHGVPKHAFASVDQARGRLVLSAGSDPTTATQLPLGLMDVWHQSNADVLEVTAAASIPQGLAPLLPAGGAAADGPRSWSLWCSSAEDAEALALELQLAGCVMHRMEDRYDLDEVLGEGSSAKVFLGRDRSTGEEVAVKVVPRVSPEEDEKLIREALLLRVAKSHPSILHFKGLFVLRDPQSSATSWALVTELLRGGELRENLASKGPLDEARARCIIRQLLSAADFLHARGVVHRDIKAENVLLWRPEGGDIKLADLGLAGYSFDPVMTKQKCGSAGYIAPEVLGGMRYDGRADCFGVGVVMYICLCGSHPFPGATVADVLKSNYRCRIDDSELAHLSRDARDLLGRLLARSPRARPTAQEALDHAWLSKTA